MFEITKQTVNASEGQFEEHPESYRPRVFVAIKPYNDEPVLEVYELLTNGQAISWDCLPQECCGFDFWTVYADSIHDITMTRAPKVLPTEVKVLDIVHVKSSNPCLTTFLKGVTDDSL